MSNENEAADEVCASCGRPAVDDVKLKKCTCNLVKYCTVDCQDNHREQHEEECKKRMAEIRDDNLFEQPDRSRECPICFLPLSLDITKSIFMQCCSQFICNGCDYANQKREIEGGLEHRCPFCREQAPISQEEADKQEMERVKKKCPHAMSNIGRKCLNRGDYETSFEYLTKAAGLGVAEAHYELSIMYRKGQGVEKDIKKQVYHSEEAAIVGHHMARHNLGCIEAANGRFDRARKHFIIAANLGLHESLQALRQLYADGHASKEEYAAALRTYQSAVEATKSAEREEAKAFDEYMKSLGIKDHGGAIFC